MEQELKHKVGDKVYFEGEIIDTYSTGLEYRLESRDSDVKVWFKEKHLKPVDALQQRPKVTQDLMDWYENSGKELDFDLFDLFTDFNKGHYVPSVVYNWLTDGESVKDNQQRQYALATLLTQGPEAVEVAKEPLYVVAIPDYGRDEVLQLYKSGIDGKLRFNRESKILCGEVHKLTESEIKAKDERLWVFAQPVEEVSDD